MKRAAFNWLFFAALATIAFLIVRMLIPGRGQLVTDIYVITLGVFGVLALVSALGTIASPEDESELEEALEPEAQELPRVPELDRLERELALAAGRAFDLHVRLRPVLREIATARLQRRGLSLGSGSPAVRDLLGEQLWEWTAPDRAAPHDRQARGPGLDELERTVERLERL